MTNRLYYGWIVVLAGLLATIGAHGFGRMSYTIILPAMKDGLHLSYMQLGLIGTGNFIGYLLMAIVGGFLASRFGPRVVISLGLGGMAVTIVLTGLVQSFESAFAMRLLVGMGNGACFVPAMSLGSIWFPAKKRGLATGIVSAGIGSGTVITGFLVPFILGAYGAEGWKYSWYVLGVVVAVIAVVVALLIRNRPEDPGLNSAGSESPASSGVLPKTASPMPDWSGVYKLPAVWYLGVVYFMYGFSYIIYMTFFAAYLVKEMNVSTAEAGRLWALVGALSIVCGVLWGGLSDRLGRGKGAALAFVVLGLSYAVFALSSDRVGLYISAVLFGLTAWSIPTIMAAAAGDYVGARMAPAGLGFMTLFFGIGQALGPGIGGYLADLTHSFRGPFLLACSVSAVGCVLSLLLRPSRSHEA